jgi:hypothetical protein
MVAFFCFVIGQSFCVVFDSAYASAFCVLIYVLYCVVDAGNSAVAKMLKEMQSLSFAVHKINMGQPQVMQLHAINPSSLMYTQNHQHYTSMCEQLGLEDPVLVYDTRQPFKGKQGNIQFDWGDDVELKEDAAYDPMREFINKVLPRALENHGYKKPKATGFCYKVRCMQCI